VELEARESGYVAGTRFGLMEEFKNIVEARRLGSEYGVGVGSGLRPTKDRCLGLDWHPRA
jgi:hypothetical protein